ncbi:MAG TPA: Calx-beta domain-containing protein [Pyrinomonadaceae bacterium]|nr:Calx-beta domain-containing protein [Pyrinomonadaceae bacterium]
MQLVYATGTPGNFNFDIAQTTDRLPAGARVFATCRGTSVAETLDQQTFHAMSDAEYCELLAAIRQATEREQRQAKANSLREILHSLAALILVVIAVGCLSVTVSAATFQVTTTADNGDNVNPTAGSLRKAILDANANPGADDIVFLIAGSGVQTISPPTRLPNITDPVTIDGYTQNGASKNSIFDGDNAVLKIEINGANAGAGFAGIGFTITGGSTTIRGLVINRFQAYGIQIGVNGPGNNHIEGCFIGTDPTGTISLPNLASGIYLNRSNDNVIGGTTPESRNLISGVDPNNNGSGITATGNPISGLTIQGNYIGTNAAGTAALVPGSKGTGINIDSSVKTMIGGTVFGARNLISGNGTGVQVGTSDQVLIAGNYIGTDTTGTQAVGNRSDGVKFYSVTNSLIGGSANSARNIISGTLLGEGIGFGQASTGNLIQGNYIGTDVTGNVALGNQSGIAELFGGAVTPANNKIGGSAPGEGNLISGNKSLGINLNGDAGNNVIQGNLIGTNAGGTAALPNGDLVLKQGGGIALTTTNNNTIGGATFGARNVISGNANYGLLINGSSGDVVQGNFIGVDINGAALGNTGRGIQVLNGSHDCTIGGTAAGAGNVVAFNGAAGITLFESGAATHVYNIAIRGNAVYANIGSAGPGIDLGDNGITPNDSGDGDSGPNNLQNFPTLSAATSGGGITTIAGTLNSDVNKQYRIEFFASPQCSASGYGEGQAYLGSTDVTTNGNDAGFSVNLPVNVQPGNVVTATATDSSGNTSEFSPCLLLNGLPGGGTLQFSAANFNVNENAGNATVTVDRAGGDSSAVSVHYSMSAISATAGSDYTSVSGTLNWAAGDLSSKTFTVPIKDDTLNEFNETAQLGLSNPTGGATLGNQKQATLTIIDDDPLPSFSISDVSVVEGNSGTTAANFTVSLSAASGKTTSVSWKTAPGTATPGVDYTDVNSSTVTFQAGQTSKTITVNVIGDTASEPDETFFVTLFTPNEATIAKAQGTGTIINDDGAAPAGTLQFSASTYSVSESGGQAIVTVTRTGGSNGAVSVQYATTAGSATAGSDYTDAGGTLNWADGDTADKTFVVPITDDSLNELNETVNLNLSNASGGAALGNATSVLTIVDDDPKPTVSINDVTKAEGNSGTTNFDFEVKLSAASGQTVSVDYTTFAGTAVMGTDFQPVSGTLTFNPGETLKQITVLVNGDTQDEPDENFTVEISKPVNATYTKYDGIGTIVNDDAVGAPAIHFTQPNYQVFENLGAMTLTVTRSGDTSAAASVDYETADGTAVQKSDFEYAAGTLTFGPGETSKTITVLLNEDALVEGNEHFNVQLSNPAGAALDAQNTAIVSIVDDVPEAATNSIDDAQNFVAMHYHDFLNREPDAAGLAFWTNEITSCGNDQQCIDAKRVSVSGAFFLSIEFQQTGYLRYLVEKESFGSMPKYTEFMRDVQEVSRGVVVKSPGWEQQLADNQHQFAEAWISRPAFKAMYDPLSNTDYVNALYVNAGIIATQAERLSRVNALDTANEDRAAVLLDVAADAGFKQREQNAAFVLMQYFGYLRRDPQAAPDSDLSGYNFWLNKLNSFGGDWQQAEMVKAFITSTEYRTRFGQ